MLGIAGIDDAPELAPRDRRVLAALVVMSGRFCAADRLAAALYGDQDPPHSWRKVVQGSIMRLRGVLGVDPTWRRPHGEPFVAVRPAAHDERATDYGIGH